VSVTTGDIVGLEALLRWHQPDLGNVLPDRFVPLLEENGLIVPVGEWALGEVCRQLQAWSARGLRIPRVALNLSARQIQRKDLRRCIEGAISGYGLAPELLELEITESVLMSNPEHAARVLSQLKHLGMRIALDDFGTGYSSLSYLKNFSLDALKIDRSFVKDMTVDRDDAVIVEAIIALARSLKLHTVAEGVEDADQLALLVSLGCDDYQGYYFSPPVPPEEIGKKLEERVALSN
jgi:EAL domain-containing protein (putative c-di-GMP-specific phosphodiesterase class I)